MLFCSFSCHSKDGKASRGRPICGMVCPSLVRCLDVFLLSFYFSLYLKAVFFFFFSSLFLSRISTRFFFFPDTCLLVIVSPLFVWLFYWANGSFRTELPQKSNNKGTAKRASWERPWLALVSVDKKGRQKNGNASKLSSSMLRSESRTRACAAVRAPYYLYFIWPRQVV